MKHVDNRITYTGGFVSGIVSGFVNCAIFGMKDFYNTHSKCKPLPKKSQWHLEKSKDIIVISGKRHHKIL